MENMRAKHPKRILVAPLHWGLGHAARCIPIINELLKAGHEVILASDGGALHLLRKEFPKLEFIELPSYEIEYSRKGSHFKLKLFIKLPHIRKTVKRERKLVKAMVKEGKIDGIISDNRLGVYSKKVPSVFVTHQLNVLSGNTSWLSSKAHQKVIKKFDECWVPDIEGPGNLSGRLGHLKKPSFSIRYIGLLSRMEPKGLPVKHDILCLLSGPEPQRTMLEERLIRELGPSGKKILLIRGVVEDESNAETRDNLTIVNFLTSEALEKAIDQSEIVIARSGYTTLMDLAAFEKKAFFIPTPGQYEQEYLADRLKKQQLVPSCRQNEFRIEKLKEISNYKGLSGYKTNLRLSDLFYLFERE
jgi:predicted glycosyltransferase